MNVELMKPLLKKKFFDSREAEAALGRQMFKLAQREGRGQGTRPVYPSEQAREERIRSEVKRVYGHLTDQWCFSVDLARIADLKPHKLAWLMKRLIDAGKVERMKIEKRSDEFSPRGTQTYYRRIEG